MALRTLGVLAFIGLGLAAMPLTAAELPKAMQKILQDTKLPESILSGLDKELEMPAAWIDGAKKEKQLRIAGTEDLDQFQTFIQPFHERYPYIDVKYSRGTRFDRVTKPLLSYKAGRVVADVISGIGAEYNEFKDIGALENLSALPNWKNVPANMQQKDGWWVGQRLRYWCMSYNTQKVTKAELPKTWDDLVTNAALSGGKLGMGNRPNLWLLPMWESKGEAWTRDYSEKLFANNKPQLRKEGMNALIELAIAGEYNVVLPAAEYRTKQLMDKGAPIAWHCPEPVPMAISELIVVKGGNTNAAFMFTNWFLSKEGQVAQFAAFQAPPVHKDLQTREFLAFPDEILGRPVALLEPDVLEGDLDKLVKFWDPLWYSGMGLKLQVVKVTLDEVAKNALKFKANGSAQTAKLSDERSRISVNGETGEAGDLKVGMACEITYAGNNQDATRVECKQ
ncbi:MAG TPA: extracellular solute-binding protein [Alphaproteobacteria bacterium]